MQRQSLIKLVGVVPGDATLEAKWSFETKQYQARFARSWRCKYRT